MITATDLYHVMTAVVPLYVAMILAYGSVKWWRIFTPDQCSGINRFVALFAVPLLSFHFISSNNIYTMNLRFLAADTLQKLIVLVLLSAWSCLLRRSHLRRLDWTITLFSLSTLPNTLVMGIPLLKGMYGDFSGDLMVQIVVLQCIIWYTLMLFLFEFRAAKLLIADQFPNTAAAIASITVDSDVTSLDGHRDNLIETAAEVTADGKLHVTVRRSNASRSDVYSARRSMGLSGATPRPSNLTNAEIYSLQSSRNQTPRGSSFNHSDFYSARRSMGLSGATPRPSNLTNAEIYSLQSSRNQTPRGSSFNHSDFYAMVGRSSNFAANDVYGMRPTLATPRPSNYEEELANAAALANKPRSHYPMQNAAVFSPTRAAPKTAAVAATGTNKKANGQLQDGVGTKDLHMFVWSSSASPVTEVFGNHHEYGLPVADAAGVKDVRMAVSPAKLEHDNLSFGNMEEGGGEGDGENAVEEEGEGGKSGLTRATAMPPASVMTRLILIMVWRKLIRNPNTYSSLIGIIWSLVCFKWQVEMPAIISGSIAILSNAGLGMAMFSLGLFMALQPRMIACGNKVAAFAMAMRFLAGPAVMAAASFVIGLRGALLRVAIVQAALPQGIVPFVFAKEYNVHPDILSTGVIFGMLVALPITLVYYILLGLY